MKEGKVLFSNDVLLENSDIMELNYWLTENYSETEHSTYYGVKVTKCVNGQIESEEVEGISSSKDKAVAILKKLCEYKVTPISLVEILDEMETIEELTALGQLTIQ